MRITRMSAAALALTIGMSGGAFAQDAEDTSPETTPEAGAAPLEMPGETASFTDEQLEAFVAAALSVAGIQQEAAAQLMTTEDQTEQDEVLQQANQDMIDAIESEEGISVPEYIAIAEAAETDPALRAQLEEMIVSAQTEQ